MSVTAPLSVHRPDGQPRGGIVVVRPVPGVTSRSATFRATVELGGKTATGQR
ncbi:MAG: hypothetical protein ABW219_10905 [Ilumatobacteraceae bacterium]